MGEELPGLDEFQISLNRRSARLSRYSWVVTLPTDFNIALVYLLISNLATSVGMKMVPGRGFGCLHLDMDLTLFISCLL